jgi:hypothetical protein
MLPGTSERVPSHTDHAINERIRQQTEARVTAYAGTPGEIPRRLAELEREWDIERTLEVNGSVLALTGLLLGVTSSRRWLLLPGAVLTFCLQHALQGWCPPLPLFRRIGIRTQREIDEERYALKALRGDFDGLPSRESVDSAAQAPRALFERVRT